MAALAAVLVVAATVPVGPVAAQSAGPGDAPATPPATAPAATPPTPPSPSPEPTAPAPTTPAPTAPAPPAPDPTASAPTAPDPNTPAPTNPGPPDRATPRPPADPSGVVPMLPGTLGDGTSGRTVVLAAAEPGAAEVGITKTVSSTERQPGEELQYTLVAQCSSLVEDCVGFTVTDVLPPDLEVTSLPQSNSSREVTFDPVTGTLTVAYRQPVDGGTGLPAGAAQSLAIGMRVPLETALTDGEVVTNTGRVTATNAAPAESSVDVTARIPVRLDPVTTKTWGPGAAIAETGAASTVTIGARNASSSSSQVRELVVADTTPAVFDRFDLTGAGTLDRFPAGADQVEVELCPNPVGTPCAETDWVAGPPQTGAVPLALGVPAGVPLGSATGIRFRFSDSGGGDLPYDPTDARVAFELVLRDTLRSDGSALNPTVAQRVENCSVPSLTNATALAATGTPACAPFTIQPGNSSVGATKEIFPDSAGDYRPDGRIIVGASSGVSMKITGRNTSAFAVPRMTITEPSPGAVNEFDKIDVRTARVTMPAGATTATLSVACRTGADPAPVVLTAPPRTVSVADLGCGAGTAPASVSVRFDGESPGGDPLILPTQSGSLELHGTAERVTTADATDGLLNCAEVVVSSETDGTGAATADACAVAAVENPRPSVGGGTKSTNGVTTIVAGQPLDYTVSFRNNGNVPVTNVVLADPPDPTAPGNSFDVVRLRSLTLPASPAATAEVYDPQASAYVPYVATDAALLARARGIRVTTTGNLLPDQRYSATVSVLLRDGQSGATFRNCAAVGLARPSGTPFCSQTVGAVDVPGSGASLNKLIVNPTVVRPQPGIPPQVVTVKHRLLNTGTLYLKRLQLTDDDPDFFDAVEFKGNVRVNFPKGANRVQVDVCTSVAACAAGTFVNGTRTSSATPGLPAGVAASTVKGVRVTFTNSNNGYEILPSPNFPTTGSCTNATVCFDAQVREFLDSAPTTRVPDQLLDTSEGLGESQLQPSGGSFAIPPVSATLEVVQGVPRLSIDKGPDSRIGPGDTAPFSLVVTNTGTDVVTDPVVVDPLPAGLTFDPVLPGAPAGQPYSVGYTLPAGVAAPSTVDFTQVPGSALAPPTPGCTDVNRTCTLRWQFSGFNLPPGGKITLRFNVRLSPGVLAGQTVTNTAGASGADPDLACTSPTSVVNDTSFGAGRFCTDTARVTVLAGDDFAISKWVAADPSLGFRNAAGQPVPVSSPECPRYQTGGRVYTRFPCTARVLPGGTIDYLIRGVNSGTNPLKSAVLVDGLPVQGDTGVLLTNQQRGTEWSARPTMLTPVTPVGVDGSVATGYTTNAFPGASFCTSNLRPPPNDTCPPGAFAAGFGPGVTGFRSTLTFDDANLLAPGESVALAWQMQAPATLASAASEPVAWNSFALRPTFRLPGGGTSTLPATEPVKVGVSMPLGSFSVTKVVVGLPATVPPQTFALAYECEVQLADGSSTTVASGTFSLDDAGVFTSPLVPAGAVCRAWETDSRGGQSTNLGESNAAVLTVEPSDGPEQVTVTNTFDTGSVTVRKRVTWDGVPPVALPGPFLFEVACSFPDLGDVLPDFPQRFELADGDELTIPSLPVGAFCLLTEDDQRGAVEVGWVPSNGVAVLGDTALVQVEPESAGGTVVEAQNVYRTGGVKVVKELVGDASFWAQGPFEVEVDCVDPDGVLPPVRRTERLSPRDLEVVVSPVPVDYECTVTETDRGDAAAGTVSPSGPVTIPDYTTTPPGPVVVTLTNEYPAGTVTVAKQLAGDAAALMADALFSLRVQCERDLVGGAGVQEIVDQDVVLRGGEQFTLSDPLPLGARCWATETDSVGATSVSISHDATNKVAVTGATPDVTITATNTYDAGGACCSPDGLRSETGIRVTKTLTGSAAQWAQGPFEFATECTLGGFTLPPFPTLVLGPADLVGYVNPVPVGATCTVTETADGSAAGAVPRLVGTVVAPDSSEPAVDVTATNEFPGGSVEVAKQVTGAAADLLPGVVAEVTVTCERDLVGGGTETIVEAVVDVPAGRTVTAATGLPDGARCWGVETGTAGATGSSVDFGSSSDSVVVRGGAPARITATNSYALAALTVAKAVEGGAPERSFAFAVDCRFTPPGGAPLEVDLAAYRDGTAAPAGATAGTAVFSLVADEFAELEVPAGSVCAVEEVDDGGAERVVSAVSTGAPTTAVAVTAATRVDVTNVFPPASVAGLLASTGGDALRPLLAGLLLVALGLVLVASARRREQR